MSFLRTNLLLSICFITSCQASTPHAAEFQLNPVFIKHFKNETVSQVDISSDGKYFLAASSVEKMRAWNIQNLDTTFEAKFESEIVSLQFVGKDNRVFFASGNGSTRILNHDLNKEFFEYRFPITSRFAAISDDLKIILYGERIFNRTKNNLLKSVVGHAAQSSLGYSNLNTVLSSGFHDKHVTIRDFSGKLIVEWSVDEPVQSAAISKNGETVIAGTQNGNCYVWQIPSQQIKHRCNGTKSVNTVYINQSNNITVLVRSKSLTAYNLQPFTKIFEQSMDNEIYSSSLADNGWLAIGLVSGKIQLWDITNGTLVATTQMGKERITAIAINSKEKLLLSGSYDGDVTLYQIED